MALATGAFAQSSSQNTQSTDGQASPSPSVSPPSASAGQPDNPANRSAQTSAQQSGQEQGQPQGSQSGQQPDNTGRNKADQPTAEDQGNSPQDREMTRNIRRELMQADNLSTLGKNVKVITENGKVTLRGPVDSEQEKAMIAGIAAKVAGPGNVTDQLEAKKR